MEASVGPPPSHVSTSSIAEKVAAELAPYLGPFNAKVAVKTFAERSLDIRADALTIEHLPQLLDALRPMLNTFVGREAADALVGQIQRSLA